MNKEEIMDILFVLKNIDPEFYTYVKELEDYIKNLQKKAELGEHYKHLYSEVKKQKDDVVENAKEKIKRYESYIHDLKNGNYPSPTVRQERQELIFRIKEQEELLRMLGEIE